MKRAILILAVLAIAIGMVTSAFAQQERAQQRDVFSRTDRNGDGFITHDELPDQFPSQQFELFDRDKDGKISKQEMDVVRKHAENQRRLRASLPKPDLANISYGPHKRNVFDLWKAKSETPTPLVLYIHGGGFLSGDKRTLPPQMLSALLKANVSVAATNYRFTRTAVYPAPMHDCAQALQFLRLHAEEYNIDPGRVGATGGSAGAGISLWLAAHDDLAKPKSEDPLERQSTRLQCAVVFGAQSSYDPRFIRKLFNTTKMHPAIPALYGMKSAEDIDDPRFHPLFEDASPINHATADDAPVMLIYSQANDELPPDTPGNVHIHHPKFGLVLKPKLDALKVECVVRLREDYADKSFDKNAIEETVAFLLKHLARPAMTPATPEQAASDPRETTVAH